MPTASPAAETAPLADSFEELDDPRDGETYPLGEIVVLVVCATTGRVRYDQWRRHVRCGERVWRFAPGLAPGPSAV